MPKATIVKHRDSNIELFRIVLMLLIVASHYNFFGAPLKEADPDSINTIFYRFLSYVGGKPGIDSFILITGYFMCKKEISIQKYLKLLGQIWFYNFSIFFVFYLLGKDSMNPGRFIDIFLPFRYIHTDKFIYNFLLFYLTIPFVNALLRNLTEKQHRWLIVLCLYCFVFLPATPFTYSDVNEMVWYDVLFIIAAYIRLHPQPIFQQIWPWLLGGAISVFLTCFLCVINVGCATLVGPTNSPLALSMSVCFFLVFLNLQIDYVPIINHFCAATFGVLLIHSNSAAMRDWVYLKVIDNVGNYYSAHFILYSLFCICATFVVCAIIDIVRIRTIEKLWMRFITYLTQFIHG